MKSNVIYTLTYCSPSQSLDEFDTFSTNFELLVENTTNQNPFVSVIIDSLDAMTRKLCSDHKMTY